MAIIEAEGWGKTPITEEQTKILFPKLQEQPGVFTHFILQWLLWRQVKNEKAMTSRFDPNQIPAGIRDLFEDSGIPLTDLSRARIEFVRDLAGKTAWYFTLKGKETREPSEFVQNTAIRAEQRWELPLAELDGNLSSQLEIFKNQGAIFGVLEKVRLHLQETHLPAAVQKTLNREKIFPETIVLDLRDILKTRLMACLEMELTPNSRVVTKLKKMMRARKKVFDATFRAWGLDLSPQNEMIGQTSLAHEALGHLWDDDPRRNFQEFYEFLQNGGEIKSVMSPLSAFLLKL